MTPNHFSFVIHAKHPKLSFLPVVLLEIKCVLFA